MMWGGRVVKEWTLDDKAIAAAAAWAKEADDTVLTTQLSVAFNLNNLCRSIAIAEKAARAFRLDSSYGGSKITSEAVSVIEALRLPTATSAQLFQTELTRRAFQPEADNSHFPFLDGKILHLGELQADLMRTSLSLQNEFSEVWEKHAADLIKLLESYQPLWQPHKESLLSNDEVCRILLANTEGHKKTGPLAAEAKSMLKLFKKLHSRDVVPQSTPLMVRLETKKTLQERADDGITMVCFTFAIWMVRTEFPGYSLEKASKSVDQIREKFKAHRVSFTAELEMALKGLEQGRRPPHRLAIPLDHWITARPAQTPSTGSYAFSLDSLPNWVWPLQARTNTPKRKLGQLTPSYSRSQQIISTAGLNR